MEGLNQQTWELPTGVTLNVMERPGTGIPLICLHGIWDDSKYWLPLVPPGIGPLDERPLLLLDLRGHGASSKPETGYTLSDYTADLVALIAESGYDKVSLAGHSLGALTALLAAAQVPERIESLLLEDPPLPLQTGNNDVFRALLELKQQSFESAVEEFTFWRPWLAREDAEASTRRLLNTADGVLREASDGRLGDVSVPTPGVTIEAQTLVIRAGIAEQRALGDEGLDMLRSVLPNLIMVTIPDTSHNVLREQPEKYRQVLAAF